MKRGERRMWRKLAELATAVADSDDYAQEYIARRNVEFLVKSMQLRNGANLTVFGVYVKST